MNIEGAYLHVLGDLLSSVGVVIASVIIWINPLWWYADPICTYVFTFIILFTTFPLFKRCLAIMMESTPDDVNLEKLKHEILSIDDKSLICSIHDLHCWKIGGSNNSLTCHIKIHDGKDPYEALKKVNDVCAKFKLTHSTIQVESENDTHGALNCKSDYMHKQVTTMLDDHDKMHSKE